MALYLGSERVKIALGSVSCCLNLVSVPPTTNWTRLLSSDKFVLKDSSGRYLVPKNNAIIDDNVLLSADDYMLMDADGTLLTI